tara:strand:+ start:4129 stop:4626 length:498 start_codon:yes stop_codon:yes gene_type:complete
MVVPIYAMYNDFMTQWENKTMVDFEIIVGSVLGASEYVAEAIEEKLTEYKLTSQVHLSPDLTEISNAATWIICTSTHGAGDLPDNIHKFIKQVESTDLSGTTFILVGLGDSSYDTFCHGALKIEKILKNSGARLDTPALNIDVLNQPIPEHSAIQWLEIWLDSRG